MDRFMKTLITFLGLSVTLTSFALDRCNGKQGYRSIDLELQGGSRFVLQYREYPPHQFGYSAYRKGTFAVDENGGLVLTDDKGKWAGSVADGGLTYRDFLVEPTDPAAPPITRTFPVVCR